MKYSIKCTVLVLSACCVTASITRLNAQSYPHWDNSPNADLTAGGPSYLTRGVGSEQYVYYIGNTDRNTETGPKIWRWNKCSGWELIGDFYYPESQQVVRNLTIHDNYLYVVGDFSKVHDPRTHLDTNAKYIVKYNLNNGYWNPVGNDDLNLTTNVIGAGAVTVDDAGNIYVGAFHITLGEQADDEFTITNFSPVGLLKWNGTNWSKCGWGMLPMDPWNAYDSIITDLDTDGTNIFVIGGFCGAWQTSCSNLTPGQYIPSHGIIKWDGTNWQQMGMNMSGLPYSGSYDGFSIDGIYTGIFGINVPTDYNNDPWSLSVSGTNLFVVGPIDYPHSAIVRFSTINGYVLPCADLTLGGGNPWPSTSCFDVLLGLVSQNGNVYVSGRFDCIGSLPVNGIACWTNDGSLYGRWTNLSSGLTLGGSIGYSPYLAADNNAVFVSYNDLGFNLAGGLAISNRPSIARWMTGPDPAAADPSFNPGTDGWINDVAVQNNGQILIAGSFTHLTNAGIISPCLNVARMDSNGVPDVHFNTNAAAVIANFVEVDCVAVDSAHRVYVGGVFSPGQSEYFGRIIRLDSEGHLDKALNDNRDFIFDTDAGGCIWTFSGGGHELNVAPYTDITVGGCFNTIGGMPNYSVADIMIGTSAGYDGCVDGILQYPGIASGWAMSVGWAPNGMVVGGAVSSVYGDNNIIYANDSNPSQTFSGGADSWVNSFAIQSDGKIVVGGDFSDFFGRFNADGTVDTSFNANVYGVFNYDVICVFLQSDGKILASDAIGGLKRFNLDGTIDNAFTLNGGTISKMVRQPDGKILVVGGFSTFGGQTHHGIARFYP